jgi:pyruvate formate lyase activating enzyme
LSNAEKSIIIRIPLIPEYNDSSENIQASAEFLSGLKSVERVDLLAYHIFGKIKYEQLGRKYLLNVLSLSDEHLNNIKQTFENYGLKVQLGG